MPFEFWIFAYDLLRIYDIWKVIMVYDVDFIIDSW